MNFLFYINLYMLVCALAGFIYGVVKFFKKSQPLYVQFVTCALGCSVFHRLYLTVMYATEGANAYEFNVGYLALGGCFLFLFATNFGVVDRIVDDGYPKDRRSRLMALIAPAVILAGYAVILFSKATVSYKIICAVIVVFIAMASYFHMKHLIFPDVKDGFTDSLRGFNALALAFALLSMAEITLNIPQNKAVLIPVYAAYGIVSVLLLPVLGRGIRKWKI